jgi:hypothetical protein
MSKGVHVKRPTPKTVAAHTVLAATGLPTVTDAVVDALLGWLVEKDEGNRPQLTRGDLIGHSSSRLGRRRAGSPPPRTRPSYSADLVADRIRRIPRGDAL